MEKDSISVPFKLKSVKCLSRDDSKLNLVGSPGISSRPFCNRNDSSNFSSQCFLYHALVFPTSSGGQKNWTTNRRGLRRTASPCPRMPFPSQASTVSSRETPRLIYEVRIALVGLGDGRLRPGQASTRSLNASLKFLFRTWRIISVLLLRHNNNNRDFIYSRDLDTAAKSLLSTLQLITTKRKIKQIH